MDSRQENSEILSIVDSCDRVIGSRRRDDIHRLGLRHRASHVLLFNLGGYLFVQKRSFQKDNNPGLWDSSAAGHVDAGETYDECCLRELAEELGLAVGSVPERLFKVEACVATGMEFSWVYRLFTDKPLTPDYSEIETGMWCDVKNLDRWLEKNPEEFAATFKLIWKIYRDK